MSKLAKFKQFLSNSAAMIGAGLFYGFPSLAFPSFGFAQTNQPALIDNPISNSDITGAIVPISEMGTLEVIQAAIFLGALSAALLAALWLIRLRAGLSAENAVLRDRLADLSAQVERQNALIETGDAAILVWSGNESKPELIGGLPVSVGVPANRASMLGFGRWLDSTSVSQLNRAIAKLRQRAEGFTLTLNALSNVYLKAEGRTSGARAIVRFSLMNKEEAKIADLTATNVTLLHANETQVKLLEHAPFPSWRRNADGVLAWVNPAYVSALASATLKEQTPSSAKSAIADILQNGTELLEAGTRSAIAAKLQTETFYRSEVTTVIASDRKRYEVTEVASTDGATFGVALDIGALETLRTEIKNIADSHAGTINLLSTAIAVFDAKTRLTFFNDAFRALWDLDSVYLESEPTHELVLDRLRSDGKLEEQPKWRDFKDKILSAYRDVEPTENLWHLPDAQVLRVISNPNPLGGLTVVFENLTREYSLKSQNQTLHRVQTETLDHLVEGVAVFGTDGRLSLHNAAFMTLWDIEQGSVALGDHVKDIGKKAAPVIGKNPWASFTASITGFDDERTDMKAQIDMASGVVLSSTLLHLPDGQTMLTFVNITDSVEAERLLLEKNTALEGASNIKTSFVQRVSHSLRAPLTSIKGFAEVLRLPSKDGLTDQQLTYLDNILQSSNILELMINDILDLSTIDAGMMQLDVSSFDIQQCITEAVQMLGSRLTDNQIKLNILHPKDLKTMEGDVQRIRQVFYNILDNASNYAPENSTIDFTIRNEGNMIAFVIKDQGAGIPEAHLADAFKRFEPHLNNGRRRGVGLGLSVAESFIALHGGTIALESKEGQGTKVTCTLPMHQNTEDSGQNSDDSQESKNQHGKNQHGKAA